MKKFKKLICMACAALCYLGAFNNTFAMSPKIEVYSFTNRPEYGSHLPNNEGVWFYLISPKGHPFLSIFCVLDNDVPYGMTKELLPSCTKLLNKCNDGSIHGSVSISTEKYRELTRICQTILSRGRHQADLATKESMFKILITNIFKLYSIDL